jgi:hypothetical protein
VRLRRPPPFFDANHCTMQRCDCGCRALKFVLRDEAGNARAAASFLPENWLPILMELTAECHAMLSGDDARPPGLLQ